LSDKLDVNDSQSRYYLPVSIYRRVAASHKLSIITESFSLAMWHGHCNCMKLDEGIH